MPPAIDLPQSTGPSAAPRAGISCSRREALTMLGSATLALGSGIWGGCQKTPRVRLTGWVLNHNQEHRDLMIERFSRRQPAVDLALARVIPERRREVILAGIRSRSLPDVFVVDSSMLPLLEKLGLVSDLFPLAKAEGLDLEAMLVPWDYRRSIVNGKLLGLPPFSEASGGMLYRADAVIERAGLNPETRIADWPGFVSCSRLLVGRLNPGDRLDVAALDPFNGATLLAFLAFGSGHPLVSADGRFSRLDDPAVLRVLRTLDEYVETVYGPWGGYRGLLAWRAANVRQRRDALRPFAWGTKAFHVAGSWAVGRLRLDNPHLRYQAQPLPGLHGLQGGLAMHGPTYAVRADATSVPIAWALAKFLTLDPEGGGHLAALHQRLTAVHGLNEGPAYAEPAHVWAGVREAARLDVPVDGPTGEDLLASVFFDLPLHRLAGVPLDEIAAMLHARLQAALDAENALLS